MALFLSTFENKIDKKGRVSVPASFRSALANSCFKGFVGFRSLTSMAIEGFSMEHMETFAQQVNPYQLFAEDQTDLTANVFADAEQLAFDGEGRIMLTPAMIAHAHLESHVAFVGRGPTFQVWNPKHFQTYQEDARNRLKQRKPTLQPKLATDATPHQKTLIFPPKENG